jgi:hypothetical protein
MMRVIGQIYILCNKSSLDNIILTMPITSGEVKQIGLKRTIPEKDLWNYSSPWYAFHQDFLDAEIYSFLCAHKQLKNTLLTWKSGIKHAIFVLTPINERCEEYFSCLLKLETLQILVDIGLTLEIAPAAIMPNTSYWHHRS